MNDLGLETPPLRPQHTGIVCLLASHASPQHYGLQDGIPSEGDREVLRGDVGGDLHRAVSIRSQQGDALAGVSGQHRSGRMAVGIAALLGLTPFALLWFAYLGLLLLGRVPGGKPPAWDAGEAIAWPTPGEKAAAELETSPSVADDSIDPPSTGGEPRRKRKQRD